MAEPPAKKVNKLGNHAIFKEFRKQKALFRSLYTAGECIDKGFSKMNACFLEIKIADPPKCRSFTKAMCHTQDYPAEATINIGSLFYTGMQVLANYTSKPFKDCLPDDEHAKEALRKLLKFLSEPQAEIFEAAKKYHDDDVSWAVILAQHLFSRLTTGGHYTLDKDYPGKHSLQDRGDYCCACERKERLTGYFGDTSFGCSHGWHGNVDILINNEVPVSLRCRRSEEEDVKNDDDDDSISVQSNCSENSEEESTEGKFSLDRNMQLLSQCIVFSFLQLKTDPSLNNYLIPLIGVHRNNVKILFYDSENDVLLKTASLELLTSDEFNPVVVVLLWLVLNYKIFGTGVPEGHDQLKAKFPEFAKDMMAHYRDDVKASIGVVREEEEDDSWAGWPRNTPRTAFPQALWVSDSDSG